MAELTPEANMEPELLPCPCCGSTEIDAGDFDGSPVYCLSCFLRALSPERWNRRPQPDMPADNALQSRVLTYDMMLPSDEALVEELARALCEVGFEWHDHDLWREMWRKQARAILPIITAREAAARSDAYAEATPLLAEAHDVGFAKGKREGIEEAAAWLLDDGTRLDYEAEPSPKEHQFWWAADKLRALAEKQP